MVRGSRCNPSSGIPRSGRATVSTNRRDFIRVAAAAGGAIGLGLRPTAVTGEPVDHAAAINRESTPRKIRLLILGGTGFIGPHQVKYAVERGHDVTIFNRGSHPGMFPGVEEMTGDRDKNELASLKGRTWDAVIDNSASGANAPEWVRDAANLLHGSVGQYLFISTRSVYRDLSQVPSTVEAPVYTPDTTPNWTPARARPYGLAKAEAEKEARKVYGDHTTIIRPGLIVGPGDETDRFTYWPVRIERGGEILAPGDPERDRIQIIDVRDLCEWAVRLCEAHTYGTFMGVGPLNGRSMAEFLYGIAGVTSAPLTWTWVPREFVVEHGLNPYRELPVWQPAIGRNAGFARFDLSREVAAGLTFRTLADTSIDTLAYHHSRPAARQAKLGNAVTPEKEAEVLRAWHAAGHD